MPAGQRETKLLVPRGRGFARLEVHPRIGSVRIGLEQAKRGFVQQAAGFAARAKTTAIITGATCADPCCQILHTSPRAQAVARCAPGRDVADRRLPREAELVSFTRSKHEE
ncbi:hypothetical protein [Bradyrhizobium uaiense]|uniref:Uncharacterized protein n=1 Tax=Bradyrhizobium uaiense TaxID=2594946 RepID=A0A6P1BIL3_9BRAD|nr:hypothetical protein [Bradyrhizobium uaiense]NEU98307.1 hypothetical protein [Bradyrhizobium uaiense]